GFVLLPMRWVVEWSYVWVSRFRRLAPDYELLPTTLAGLHFAAVICLLLPKLPSLIASSSHAPSLSPNRRCDTTHPSPRPWSRSVQMDIRTSVEVMRWRRLLSTKAKRLSALLPRARQRQSRNPSWPRSSAHRKRVASACATGMEPQRQAGQPQRSR